jgi:hypothetical protein
MPIRYFLPFLGKGRGCAVSTGLSQTRLLPQNSFKKKKKKKKLKTIVAKVTKHQRPLFPFSVCKASRGPFRFSLLNFKRKDKLFDF